MPITVKLDMDVYTAVQRLHAKFSPDQERCRYRSSQNW